MKKGDKFEAVLLGTRTLGGKVVFGRVHGPFTATKVIKGRDSMIVQSDERSFGTDLFQIRKSK